MMKYILFLLVALGMEPGLRAQTAEDSVKASVKVLFDAMLHSDSATLVSAFADSALLQSVSVGKDDKTKVTTDPIHEFAALIKKLPAGAADERIRFETVRVDGPLAMVWAPYTFYYNGKLNHCGADSFQLVRVNGVWKIQYLIDTRRKDCQ
jgi:hypothetical protein